MKRIALHKKKVLISLILLFLVYSGCLYLKPLIDHKTEAGLSHTASEGRIVWQKYNCQSCHQLYGLGGYLGPDLTNITAKEGRTRLFLGAVVSAGNARMPSFQMSDQELESVLDFLEAVNQTGTADPNSFFIGGLGMIDNAYE